MCYTLAMKYKKTTLKNGLRVLTAPMKDSPTVTALVLVTAGSKYETKEINGLSHFLEHMCFKGTERRPTAHTISKELDGMGAESNAFTGQEYTGYYAKANPKHAYKLVDILSDLYLNPIFDPKEIEKEKGVITQEILMYEDMPHRHVQDVFLELLYGDQPAGWNIAGTPETVAKMNREHFVKYRKEHYVAKKTIVVVAGHFDEKNMIKEITKAFSTIPNTKAIEKLKVKEGQKTPELKVKFKKTDQTHLVIGVRTFGVKDKDVAALKVLSTVLGKGMSSRLFQKMREELGICYYVRAGSDEYTDHGYLAISAGVDKTRVVEAVRAIMHELRGLISTPIPKEEIEKAKEYMISGMSMGLETSDSVGEFLVFQEALKKDILSPEEIEKKLRKITSKDIQRVAKNILKNDRLNMAVVGDVTDEKAIQEVLRF